MPEAECEGLDDGGGGVQNIVVITTLAGLIGVIFGFIVVRVV
ncbi:hypothetical protein [Pseudomonas wenzhouensis]|nr:hypothetical protein [Pseudomonas wenzhouensis]